MASSKYIEWLENIIAYCFRDRSLLETALTAPGAEGDKEGTEEEKVRYQGNRLLAQVGRSLLQLVIETRALSEGNFRRGDTREALDPVTAGQNHIERAKALQIDPNIKLNPRQRGIVEPRTLQLAIYAIVGAVWRDCQEDFSITDNTITRLFIGIEAPHCIDPQQISLDDFISTELLDDDSGEEYSPVDTDVIRDGSSIRANLQCDRTAASYDDQPSRTGAGNERDQEQHDPVLSNNETSVLPTVDNIPMENQSQGRTLSLRLAETPIRPKRSLRTSETSSNNVENHPMQRSIGPATKKRRSSTRNFEPQQSIQLYDYLALEKKRYRSLGLPFPWTDIDSAIRASNISLKDSDLATLKTLFFVIGSPESLVALQEILKAQRIASADKEFGGGCDLSLADRVRAIEGIGPNIAYLVLRRRCHIYQLFLDCSKGSRRTSDGFVIDTMQSISMQGGPQIGNPNNLEDSRITEEILKDVYPDLKPSTDSYQKKRRFVRNLRKLGERFDILVRTFDYGILGLLSWPRGGLLEVPALTVTDEIILSLSDAVFKSFVVYLKQVQGDHLCATSNAVSNAVTALFRAPFPSIIFALEQVESSKILEFPKGSQVLLSLIS
ncbi:hypothetical protein G7Y89_g5549 [Cudoniella acicularis]|uniref:Uncharacterized protein n=1 Tax=Cudoniella acicularis TaxID=354080 RepID=A0A8H4RN31_9HELO|nr:hypothetical protein G7Y89_g5549 [Cudoniella acicularis]